MPLRTWLRAGDTTEVGILSIVVKLRDVELRRVGQVITLGPELKPPAFCEWEVFEQRQIKTPGRWSVIRLQPEIALRQRCRHKEIRSVKPLIWIAPVCRRCVGILSGNQIRRAITSIPQTPWHPLERIVTG